MVANPNLRPQIDLEERLRFETLLLAVSVQFVNLPPSKVDQEIEVAQREICEHLGVDHSSVWQVSEDAPDVMVMTHLYRDPNLPRTPPCMNSKQFFPWCLRKILANEIVYVPDTRAVPPEAGTDSASWNKFGITSSLVIPLSAGGRQPIGALGFDSTHARREWPEPLQNRLQLVAQVFANALERKRAEQKLIESETRLTLAAHSAGAGLWTFDVAKGVLWTTSKVQELFGLSADEPLDYQTFLRLLHPDEAEAVRAAMDTALRTGNESRVEYRVIHPDGTVRWMLSVGSRYSSAPNVPYILMGVTVDITDRKRAEQERLDISRKLLKAQEAERSRIARELHDDIGQSLALLCIRMKRAGEPAGSPGKTHSGLPELSKAAGEIAKRLSEVSHQLHSSALDYLGLKVAVESACREFSEKYPIHVDCSCDHVPSTIDETAALCFFRIVQEALHNIAKHSRATRVHVHLHSSETEVSLSIEDDGCGFDVEHALLKPGLGLISMRERIQLVGGEFEIQSSPGKGTAIHVHGPIGNHTRSQGA